MDCSLPGSSVHGIFQARTLEWVAISFSRGSSQPRDGTHISCIGRQIPYHWATRGLSLAYVIIHTYKNGQPWGLCCLPKYLTLCLWNVFLPWTDLLSLCYGSLLNSFLHEARNTHVAAIPGTWPWPGTCVPSLFLGQNHKRCQHLVKDSSSSPTRSVYAAALHPGQTPPSCCFLTIMLRCMLISLTGRISSRIVHKCSGHFAELLTGMRAFI